jgi:hypothetical protein
VVVVMARRLAAPRSALGAMMGELRGLTLAPEAPLDDTLRECVAIEGDFDPTVLIGLDAIVGRRPGTVDASWDTPSDWLTARAATISWPSIHRAAFRS